jgi:YidC/Oxa1 family membrane protein insertase
MDRKSIIVLVVCLALMMSWGWLTNKLFPPKPLPPEALAAMATNAPVAGTNVTAATMTASTNAMPVIQAPAPAAAPRKLDSAEKLETLETDDAIYTFSSHWGGLKTVELKGYRASVDCRNGDAGQTNAFATLNSGAPLPALAVLGGPEVEGNGVFTMTKTGNSMRLEQTLPSGVRLVKEFTPGSNFVLNATARLENPTAAAVTLPAQEWIVGTATPMGVKDDGTTTGVFWFNGSKHEHIALSWFENRTLGCIPGTPRNEWRSNNGTPSWAAVHNQFFALIARPLSTNWPATQVISRRIDLPPLAPTNTPGLKPYALKPAGFQTALAYPAATIAPGQKLELGFELFAGPKEYYTLSRLPDRQEIVMEFTGFFGFFAKALLLSMNALHNIFHLSYGWAIVAITVIIKLVFWPLTAASTRSMKKMQALQPQVKELQAKYKDDPTKLNQKMMELWKVNKVNPASGCLPMLVQIPVFFGFFTMLKSAIELRGAGFLWMCDLSQADTLFNIPGMGWVPFLGVPGVGLPFNLMPLIYIATALWQSHLTPVSPGMDPMQQKMLRWMPLMFLVILYNFSSGLALYWTVQNLLTILQTKMTHIQEAKEKQKATNGKPVIDVTPKKKGK